MAEVDGRPQPFVMTSWHEDQPLVEAVEFFAGFTRIHDWEPDLFVVWALGDEAFAAQVRAEVLRYAW